MAGDVADQEPRDRSCFLVSRDEELGAWPWRSPPFSRLHEPSDLGPVFVAEIGKPSPSSTTPAGHHALVDPAPPARRSAAVPAAAAHAGRRRPSLQAGTGGESRGTGVWAESLGHVGNRRSSTRRPSAPRTGGPCLVPLVDGVLGKRRSSSARRRPPPRRAAAVRGRGRRYRRERGRDGSLGSHAGQHRRLLRLVREPFQEGVGVVGRSGTRADATGPCLVRRRRRPRRPRQRRRKGSPSAIVHSPRRLHGRQCGERDRRPGPSARSLAGQRVDRYGRRAGSRGGGRCGLLERFDGAVGRRQRSSPRQGTRDPDGTARVGVPGCFVCGSGTSGRGSTQPGAEACSIRGHGSWGMISWRGLQDHRAEGFPAGERAMLARRRPHTRVAPEPPAEIPGETGFASPRALQWRRRGCCNGRRGAAVDMRVREARGET